MPYNIRIVSTYPPRKCGIGTFARHLANAMANLTGEIGYVRIAAIDKEGLTYHIPVDLRIDQYNPQSWQKTSNDIISRSRESENPTAVLLQHEYGLDPDADGNDTRGTNFVQMAKKLREAGLITMAYLHTVLDDPDEHQRTVLQDLAKNTDGLFVPTRSAVDILESDTYGIKRTKIKHIDHGIRMHNPSQYDRLELKKAYGLEGKFLFTSIGLHSPGKGLKYSIRAFGKFLSESCTAEQRSRIVYVIAGKCHPEFIKYEDGEPYRKYMAELKDAVEQSGLTSCRLEELDADSSTCCDVIFFDKFLDEADLLQCYGAANVMVLPYLNMQQISSGILADTIGAGRAAVATKFRYAVELLDPQSRKRPGLIIGSHARGVLLDPGEPSIEQMAQAFDYLLFNQDRRLAMEKRAHRRGYQMRWDNTAWAILQYIYFLREQHEIVTGRAVQFTRNKDSAFDVKNKALIAQMRQ